MQMQLFIWTLLASTATGLKETKDANQPAVQPRKASATIMKTRGLLYPTESETREVRLLDGIWNFLKSEVTDPTQGLREGWYADELSKVKPTIPMPVPASYNDITTDQSLRDHVGTVWYERKMFIPRSWARDQRVWLRFGSVHYEAVLWLNGVKLLQHEFGHLPFEAEITSFVKYGSENRLTVLCDNTLLNTTVPQGKVVHEDSDSGTTIVQTYTFDFFNYAGIHRAVHLYTTPKIFIEDVTVTTDIAANNGGVVLYQIDTNDDSQNSIYSLPIKPLYVRVQLLDKEDHLVANDTSRERNLNGTLYIPHVNLWWPHLMHSKPGYLYTMEIYLHAADKSLLDVYRLKVGVRTLSWSNTTLLLNGRSIYMRGFGRHEDSDIRGKGFDYPLLARDFNLLKWIGANAYRTSHYPYSEESMQFADEHGIMIIDECPSVNTDIFDTALLRNHKSALEQLIHRDRNHPSVVLWSVANEPKSANTQANAYFRDVVEYTRSLDPSRPITASINANAKSDKLASFLDIISFNRYNAWYENAGHLNMITQHVIEEATDWHTLHNKPVIMSEYGADTVEGMHFLPNYLWSEDYQAALLSQHFKAFDILREKNWFIGEFVWNFADFKTEQTFTRVGGNKKGIFTRNRQPKMSAYLLRQRYFALCFLLDDCSVPEDVFQYVVDWQGLTQSRRSYSDL